MQHGNFRNVFMVTRGLWSYSLGHYIDVSTAGAVQKPFGLKQSLLYNSRLDFQAVIIK